MKAFNSIKYWLFDLDNTLYSGQTKVFEQVDKKMSKYISDKLNVSIDEAKKIQKNYFHEYNTTLNGMIKNHKIDANEFLEFVHDIDIDFLKKDLKLNEELKKLDGKKIIFTNGCFDILHRGHITYLNEARKLGDALVIGLNSDASVKRLKGPKRPINNESDRKFILENLKAIAFVEIFTQDTPLDLIKKIKILISK